MKISFVIPYFNEPLDVLQNCVESILSLHLEEEEREIIVVDDGSRQSPISGLLKFGDRIILLSQENGGPGAARNNGTSRAVGDYIQYVDSDDTLTSDYNLCIDVLRKEEPDVLMFNSERRKRIVCRSGMEFMLHYNLRGAAWGIVFKKNALGGLRYDTGLINEDELFNALLVLNAGKVIDAPIKAYNYSFREDSRSHNMSPDKLARRLDDMETIIWRLRDVAHQSPGQKRTALERRVSQLTMDYLYTVLLQTHGLRELKSRMVRLHSLGLYPLPLKSYTWKYWMFALITKIVRI